MSDTAKRPTRLGFSGWKSVAFRVKDAIDRDHVGLVAAGVAFYGLLAIFPAIAAVMAIGGLFIAPDEVAAQLDQVAALLPQRAAEIITEQAASVAGTESGGLGLTALIGIGLALWSASRGVSTLVEGLNIVYEETDGRGFIKGKLVTLALTAMLVIGLVAGLGAVLVLPSLLAIFPLGAGTEAVVGLIRWALLFAMTVLGAAVLYRFCPDRRSPRWSWTLPGAVLASVLWVIGSALFALYAANFGSYQETFGSLAGAVVMLFWLWISAWVILLGAELNAELEAQVRPDTTTGQPRPVGKRNAVKADQVKG
ncbi:membrane protein [Sagittula marina]|uniref:Membrane protein n=1 Tax=Sagittula marina TaxID=943940 RepID=A0A7W6DS11_9RHOB|nr:YihY/virulence factor BrkB family protein [Sagittula marina]MBB3984089.1 membrane protein [Sagittula marina]